MGEDFALLVQTFAKDSGQRIEAIQEAVTADDADALRRAAHSFKGSSGNMGAPELAELCRTLEELGRNGTTEGGPALVAALIDEYAQVQRELNQLLI
jgi:HPt (histidine-containing phosphotransfer) domain-containing protein